MCYRPKKYLPDSQFPVAPLEVWEHFDLQLDDVYAKYVFVPACLDP